MNRCRFEPKIGGIYSEAENLVLMGGMVAQWYGIKEIVSLIPGHSAAAL